MAEEGARVEVTRNEEKEQWDAHAGGETGVLTYSEHEDRLFLLHTEVPEALEGQGIAGRLDGVTLNGHPTRRLPWSMPGRFSSPTVMPSRCSS